MEELRFLSGQSAGFGSSWEQLRRTSMCSSHPPELQALLKRNVSQGGCRAGHPGPVTWLKSGVVSLSLGPN